MISKIINISFLQILLLFLALAIIGFFRIAKRIKDNLEIYYLFIEFTNRFQDYAFGKEDRTQEKFDWLLQRSDKIQNYMGKFGIVVYKPPHSNFVINHYSVVTETINSLTTSLGVHTDDLMTCRNMLVRYASGIDDFISSDRERLKNPFILIQEGISFILIIPLLLLEWTGILRENRSVKIQNSLIIKIISSIIALVGFVDGILTIVNSWDDIISWLKNISDMLQSWF